MACGIYCKVLLALLICITIHLENSASMVARSEHREIKIDNGDNAQYGSTQFNAYKFPRSEQLRRTNADTETDSRDHSDETPPANGEQQFQENVITTEATKIAGTYSPIFREATKEGCNSHETNIRFDPKVKDCFTFTSRGHTCLSQNLPSCIKIKLYKSLECRKHTKDVAPNTPFLMLGPHESFKVDESNCLKEVQDVIGHQAKEQGRVESPELSLFIPNDYPQDSPRSRWFHVNLQEFQRNGNRLTIKL